MSRKNVDIPVKEYVRVQAVGGGINEEKTETGNPNKGKRWRDQVDILS